MGLHLKNLKNCVSVTRDETHCFLIGNAAGAKGNEAVVGLVARADPTPEFVPFFFLAQINLLGQPPSEDVEISARIGAVEVVAVLEAHVGLFKERNPELAFGAVSTEETARNVHW